MDVPSGEDWSRRNESPAVLSLFEGGGEMGARMSEVDWSQTSLGPAELWPQSLKTAVRIVLTSRQPMFVWWGDELINLYNDAYCSILGGKHPGALGQPAPVVWREIWDDVGPRAELAMARNEGTYDEALLLIMERNGYPEETYYTFSYSPVPNDQGGTGGIFCANTDDTQRIIGERQLALLRELAARTADARTWQEACALSANCLNVDPYDMPFAMIYVADAEARHIALTGSSGIAPGHPAAPETVALDDDAIWPFVETISTNKAQLVADLDVSFGSLPSGPWDRSPAQAVALPIAPSGGTGRSGVLIVGLNPYRPFDDQYRRFLELVSSQIASNIANAQAYEEERKRAEALAEIDRAKTAFFSNVSHEFRTPLTLMLGPLEDVLVNDGSQGLPDDRELLTVAHRNALRLQKLVNALLDFSRLEAGRIQASYRPTDLSTLIAGLASGFRSAIERGGLTLTVDCPPLPEPVFVDHEMWEKIVLNLLSNAFKHTFEGEIKVVLRASPGKAELAVHDTGVGIPPDQLPHIFKRFHRVANARSRTYEGSGIGLALVNELVKLHGGTITVESVVDRGTTFTISLPTGKAHLPADRIEAETTLASTAVEVQAFVEEALHLLPEEPVDGSSDVNSSPATLEPDGLPATGEGAHILLADENADMRDYLRRLLGTRYSVEAVADGQTALAAAQARPPDLVLTDVMMPKLDGFGLLRELRSNPKTRAIPILMLSARAGEEARIEGMEAGADDYVVKPFSGKELLARVASQLGMARVRREATSLLEMQNRVLEMVVGGDSLSESLELLVRSVEQHSSDNVIGSILLLDETGQHLRHGAAPSLPAAYNKAIDGVMIGPTAGSCGTTAYTKRETIVSDIANDPLWDGYKDLAMEHGLRACWSTPIFSPDHGKVLGTFAMYYRQPQQPSLEDRSLINYATRTVALTIERHRLEAERQQLLARLRAASFAAQAERRKMYDLFMQAPAMIVVLRGKQHVIELANPLAVRMMGMRGDVIGKPVIEALPEIKDQGFIELLDTVYRTGKPFIGDEVPVKLDRNGDGSLDEVFVNFVYQPTYTEDGEVDGILAHAVEVTQQVLARRKLEESEAQLERALSAGSVCTWVWDIPRGVVRGDERLARMIGMEPAQVAQGLPVASYLDTIHPDDRPYIEQRIADSLVTGNQDEAEYRLVRGDNRVRWIAARGQVTYDENGKPLASSGTLVDMTERKELERQKDEFLGLASHELRTPLTTIKAYAQLLDRKSDARAQTKRLLLQVERLESLVNELLDTSRLRQGRLELRPEHMDLRELAQEVLDRFADAAERTDQHRLRLEADGPVTGNWDPARLDQVLTNLLSNALKYSPEGGEVRLAVSQQEDQAIMRVSDQGIGMTPDEQAKLFVPFHRSAQARAVSGGFGLGLHIASEIVKQHSGTITVESAPGKGTSFTVSLPR